MTAITQLSHPDISDVQLTDVLFALSDPARLEIVRELAGGPLAMAECGMTNPALPKSTKSHLIKVLREAGVVRNEPAEQQQARDHSHVAPPSGRHRTADSAGWFIV